MGRGGGRFDTGLLCDGVSGVWICEIAMPVFEGVPVLLLGFLFCASFLYTYAVLLLDRRTAVALVIVVLELLRLPISYSVSHRCARSATCKYS